MVWSWILWFIRTSIGELASDFLIREFSIVARSGESIKSGSPCELVSGSSDIVTSSSTRSFL